AAGGQAIGQWQVHVLDDDVAGRPLLGRIGIGLKLAPAMAPGVQQMDKGARRSGQRAVNAPDQQQRQRVATRSRLYLVAEQGDGAPKSGVQRLRNGRPGWLWQIKSFKERLAAGTRRAGYPLSLGQIGTCPGRRRAAVREDVEGRARSR